MRQLLLIIMALMVLSAPASARKSESERGIKDLYFAEALFQAYQQDWFAAISRLDTELAQHYRLDEPQLDSLFLHLGMAEFSVGDFELAYRMHRRAGRAINAVIEGDVEEQVRNAAIYRLARIYFHKAQPLNALHALERIEGDVPTELKDELDELSAQVLLANGRFSEAISLLKKLEGRKNMSAFAGYNLGIALLLDGRSVAGLKQLERTGQLKSKEPLSVAVKDKTNLVLGDRLLARENFAAAKTVFDRVNLEGAFSNRSLLGSGWADAVQNKLEQALVPWTLLSQRAVTDAAVQEALLAVPYAYGKLGVYSRAALLYGHALQTFAGEIDRLSESIVSIREGRFLAALARQELNQDGNWLVRLRDLPHSPETYYLLELMASHSFQEALKNYLDLDQLGRKLELWQVDLEAYDEVIAGRRDYYEPLLPEIDKKFRLLDARMRLRLEQRERIEQRLERLLTAPRPQLLMTADERISKQRLQNLSAQPDLKASDLQRIKRLQGLLDWQMSSAYDQRQTEAFTHLEALNAHISALQQQYHSFVRLRQAATQSYKGYDTAIRTQRIRINSAAEKIERLMKRQGHMLEVMAISELKRRRERLEEFQVKARFAMADSYDRAARTEDAQKVEP